MNLIFFFYFFHFLSIISCLKIYNEEESHSLILDANNVEVISIMRSNKIMDYSLVSAHSQIYNVTLSYKDLSKNNSIKYSEKITGLNVGLIINFEENISNLYLKNSNPFKLNIFIKIIQYSGFHPIPGGCNLEFPVKISPFLKIYTQEISKNELIKNLEFQKASLGSNFYLLKKFSKVDKPLKNDCDFSDEKFTYKVYCFYLKNFSEKELYLSLKKMSSVSSIEALGKLLETNQYNQPKTRYQFVSYHGKGVIYNVVVSFLNYKVAYVPIVDYNCDLKNKSTCQNNQSWELFIYFLILGLIGLIICLNSLNNLNIEIAYFSYIAGSTMSFILTNKYLFISIYFIYLINVIGGILFTILCFQLKNYFTNLIFLLSGLHISFLLNSVILSTIQIKSLIIFWILIGFGFTVVSITYFFIDKIKLHKISCSIFGSYFFISSIDQFFNGSLLILINNLLNIISHNDLYLLNFIIPFQTIDYFFSFLWIILAIFSILIKFLEINLIDELFKLINITKHLNKQEIKDDIDEDIFKYNELSRSIIGNLNNLENETSSPLIKRHVKSFIEIDLNSPIKFDTPVKKINLINQSTPNSLFKNVFNQNSKFNMD